MQKKRSTGITILSIIIVILGATDLMSLFLKNEWTIHTIIRVISDPVLVVCGIGLFGLKEWARKLSLYFGTVYAIIINFVAAFKIYNQQGSAGVGSEIVVGIGIGFIIMCIVPLCLLWWYLNHPKLKEQFE